MNDVQKEVKEKGFDGKLNDKDDASGMLVNTSMISNCFEVSVAGSPTNGSRKSA